MTKRDGEGGISSSSPSFAAVAVGGREGPSYTHLVAACWIGSTVVQGRRQRQSSVGGKGYYCRATIHQSMQLCIVVPSVLGIEFRKLISDLRLSVGKSFHFFLVLVLQSHLWV